MSIEKTIVMEIFWVNKKKKKKMYIFSILCYTRGYTESRDKKVDIFVYGYLYMIFLFFKRMKFLLTKKELGFICPRNILNGTKN